MRAPGQGVATGAPTPPEGLAPPISGPARVDELAARLQEAVGPNYQVEKTLGAGGFAVVYLLRDLNLKRKLAVKVLSPDVIQSHTALERFRREAETVAQLSHPHIVPLHFIGQKDDLVYLAMECIEGGSLADRLEKEGKLPVEDVVRVIREVASALEYAHKRGVVHRDIKPHNVLLEAETGRSLVTDFGIARTAEGASLTASGMMVGTPAYLSPEQVTGGHADHRSDIYALGVMAYEMLTGKPPFTGPTPTAVLMKRLAGPPEPIEKSRPDIPIVLMDVINGCLAQSPEERFQSAGDVVRALGGATPVSGGHPTAEITLRMRRARRRWTVYFVAAAVIVMGFAGFVLWKGLGPQRTGPAVPADMAVVPGGTYRIGVTVGQSVARPEHEVRVDSFAVGRTEVTVAAYRRFIVDRGIPAPWRQEPDSLLPITGVNYSEALAYCAWKYPGGRLPTEEEWEVAARGREGFRFPWGNVADPSAANTATQDQGRPVTVGSFPRGATASGIVDLIGNVWEWTSSPMKGYPGGPSLPDSLLQHRVIRGAAFNAPDSIATASYRGHLPATATDRTWYSGTGFRCVVPLKASRPAS